MRRGGGVIIPTRSKLSAKTYILSTNLSVIDIDQVIIKLTLSKRYELFIIASYIPPRSSAEVYNIHFKTFRAIIDNLSCNQYVLFAGDFNQGSITWSNARVNNLLFTADSEAELLLLEFIIQNNLYQNNNVVNENNILYIWHERLKSGKA